MKSIRIAGLAVACLAFATLSFAQHGHEEEAKTITVKGEVLDTACYMSHPDSGAGEDHRQCALMCTRKGVPMSVLDGEGHVYLLVPDHSNEEVYERMKEWAADQVEVSGKVVERGGLKAIVVASSKKLD